MKSRIFLLALLLASCRDAQPPLPTSEQSDQLNEAENLLDEVAAGDAQSNTER